MLSLLFGQKSFLDPEIEAWHLETWRVLLDRFASELSITTPPSPCRRGSSSRRPRRSGLTGPPMSSPA
jgi:hypothetical protein